MNLVLFFTATIIWGSTFYAIKLQLGDVPATLSVVYRFVLATIICFLIAWFKKNSLRFTFPQHVWMFLQGLCLFSVNYIFTYEGEQTLTSGLMALIFTLVIYFNTLGVWLIFKKKIRIQSLMGALLGGLGLIFIFMREMNVNTNEPKFMLGLGLGVLAPFFASIGNLISARNQKNKMPVLPTTAFSMLYGTLSSFVIFLIRGEHFVWNPQPQYLLSLLYLSLFGTVIAFLSFLTLLGRVGPERAGYVTVMAPVISLVISTYLENFSWSPMAIFGVCCCIVGNYLVLGPSIVQVPQPKSSF